MISREKSKNLGGKSAAVSLNPPWISQEFIWDLNQDFQTRNQYQITWATAKTFFSYSSSKLCSVQNQIGAHSGTVGWGTALQFRRPWVWPHYGPGVDSAYNSNEYKEYFKGGGGLKLASAQGRQPYHLHVPTVLKTGSLNLLEPGLSRPVMGLLDLYKIT
jgi:hypothetical protein